MHHRLKSDFSNGDVFLPKKEKWIWIEFVFQERKRTTLDANRKRLLGWPLCLIHYLINLLKRKWELYFKLIYFPLTSKLCEIINSKRIKSSYCYIDNVIRHINKININIVTTWYKLNQSCNSRYIVLLVRINAQILI